MEDFVRKTRGVRDITSLPLDTSHELDIVSDVKGKIYIKILNRYKELLFDNGTEQWVIDMLNNLEVDVEQLKEDILDIEQALSELPMIEDKLAAVETKLAQINTLFAQMQIDVQGLDLRTAELEREVAQLALKDQELLDKINNLNLNVDLDILYSNSTEFGDYDYSVNPNLIANINADSFSQGAGALSVVDDGDEVVVTLDPKHKLEVFKAKSQPALVVGKTYTLSVEIMLEDDFTGDPSKIGLRYIKMPNWVSELYTRNTLTTAKGVWQKLTGTVKITAASDNAESWFIMLQNKDANNSLSGKLRLRHAKLEEGSTVTPYQPNLLDAPYYLSKVALNDKIPYYKYVGINLEASKNPNDYQWIPLAKAAETVDARLTKTISTYDTVNALQNNRLTALESKVVDTTWQNVTVTEPFTSVTQPQVKKQNGIIYMRGTISNGTGDCFTLPEGFRPPAGAYEMQFRLPCRSADASDYATMYVRPSGLCSIAGVNGTKPIFLSGIIFSTT